MNQPACRPFLMVQTRPEDDAAAAETEAVRRLGGFDGDQLRVLRLDREDRPVDWASELADVAGVVLPGSPFTGADPEEDKSDVQRAVEAELVRLMDVVVDGDVPFLGCCYGVGTLGRHVGGVVDTTYREAPGPIEVTLTDEGAADPLLAGLPASFTAYVGHKEAVRELPSSAVLLATGEACPVQMFRVGEHLYATQFHPELDQAGLLQRLEIYADHGYFEEHEAEQMYASIHAADAPLPPRILSAFRTRYA